MIEYERKEEYSFYDLIKIMEILRGNCPWDKEQTHHSLNETYIEETYEVIDAIETGDDKS
jgi:tetrapyrrole methylase family protein/MazG family protein